MRGGTRHAAPLALVTTVTAVAVALSALFVLPATNAGAVTVDTVRLETSMDWPNSLAGGYYPASVIVTNPGPPFEGIVRLEPAYARGDAVTVERPVSLGRGERVRLTVPAPVSGWGQYRVRLLADGRDVLSRAPTQQAPSNHAGGGTPRASVIAVAPRAPDLRELTAAMSSGKGSYYSSEPAYVPPEALPDLWQPYSSISLCILDAACLPALDPARRRALREWIVSGGVCLLYPVRGEEGECGALAELGFAQPERWRRRAGSVGGGWARVREVGLGRCLFTSKDVFPGGRDRWKRLLVSRDLRPLVTRTAGTAGQGRFEIPGVGEPPLAAFLVIAVLFVIAIGPLNWYVVIHRMKKQALFLLTTPAIALATTVLLLAYSFASEGFGTHVRIESFAMLDAAQKRGVTWSRHAIYSGLAPRGGLVFDASTLVLPVKLPDSRRSISWRDGQRLTDGWLPARTYVSYVTCAHYPARWRVTVERRGERSFVVNGLPRGMSDLAVKTAGGLMYADAVPAGGEEALSPSRSWSKVPSPYYIDVFAKAFRARGDAGPTLGHLPEGSFVATLDGPLGAELGITRYREAEGLHVVIGVAGGNGHR